MEKTGQSCKDHVGGNNCALAHTHYDYVNLQLMCIFGSTSFPGHNFPPPAVFDLLCKTSIP